MMTTSKKTLWLGLTLLLACSLALPQIAFADRGSSHGSRSYHTKRYKHTRYYPSDFYYKKKVVHFHPQRRFFFPRRHYYYYDIYPEKIYYYGPERTYAGNNPDYLSLTSIANMASQGLPDAVIIDEIERTRSFYNINSDLRTYLRQNGVSEKVIRFMESRKRFPDR